MQRLAVASLLCACWAAQASRSAVRTSRSAVADHPIGNVIELLKELRGKVATEGQAEELTYTKFASWCGSSLQSLNKAIAGEKDAIDTLESKVDAKTQDESSLKKQIANLEVEIARYTTKGGEADKARSDANDLYKTSDQDLESTISAVNDAIAALQDAKGRTADGLLQLRRLAQLPLLMQRLDAEQRQALEEPGVTKEDILAKGSQAQHEKKYEFKSGNVVELLKGLRTMFEDERLERTKAETNSANGYSLAKDARSSALQTAETSKEEKSTLLGDTQGELNEAKASLASTREDLEADSGTLTTTKTTCSTRKAEWSERTALRAKEMQAMDAAVEILTKVSGVRSEKPSNPVPPASPLDAADASEPALLQARAAPSDPKAKALALLRGAAKRAHSKSLMRFTDEVAAHLSGPFEQVGNMIQKMIFRLMAEQKDEDDHKNWCDTEIEKTNMSKATKTEKFESFNAKIEEGQASVQVLSNEITSATEASSTLEAHVQELTDIRQQSKSENSLAVKDAEAAQKALANAIATLESYYKESGMIEKEAWELVQKKKKEPVTLPENPALWSGGYTGVADPKDQNAGVIAVLKRVASDFAEMEGETRAAEEMDSMKYQEEMKRVTIERARLDKEAEMKTLEVQRLKEKVGSFQKSLKHVTKELESVEQYLKDLAPACIEGDSTYDDRKQARSDEIAALKEAQVILQEAFQEKAPSFLAPVRRA